MIFVSILLIIPFETVFTVYIYFWSGFGSGYSGKLCAALGVGLLCCRCRGRRKNAAGCPAAVRRAFCRPKARTGRSACGADSQKPERCLGFGLLSGKRRGLFQSSPCAAVPADVAAPPAPARLGAPGREGRPSAALLCTRAGAGCVSGRDAAFSGRA